LLSLIQLRFLYVIDRIDDGIDFQQVPVQPGKIEREQVRSFFLVEFLF